MSGSGTTSVRFEQLNRLVDEISPQLPSSTHVAVLLCCYRHARRDGSFCISTTRLARSVVLGIRQVKRILRNLEKLKAIELVSEHQGPVPRRYRISGIVEKAVDSDIT